MIAVDLKMITCTICTDNISEDFAAAPCGHVFHYACLSEWLVHRKTCPQCREKCLPRQVLKLFIDGRNAATNANRNCRELNQDELRECVEAQSSLIKQKDDSLQEAREELSKVREEVEAWQAQYQTQCLKMKKQKALSESLKEHVHQMENELETALRKAKEVEQLKVYQRVERLLKGSCQDAEQMVQKSSLPTLSTYTIALKSEYESVKERKSQVQKDKDKLLQEVQHLKRKGRQGEQDLSEARSRISLLESDLQAAEQEKDNLIRKVQLLQRAMDSPDSRLKLKRMLESPMPEDAYKRQCADLGSSPDIVRHPNKAGYGAKFGSCPGQQSGALVPLPVQRHPPPCRPGASVSSVCSGFNGLGGHSQFLLPIKKPSTAVTKPLKFAPRVPAKSKTKQGVLPVVKLKF